MNEDNVLTTRDPLSTAFTTMKLRAFISAALDASGDWCIDFPGYDGFTLNVVQKGEAWLSANDGHTVHLHAGDCFLLTGGQPFTLASKNPPPERDRAEQIYTHAPEGVAVVNGGGQFFAVGIIFRFQGHLPSILFRNLPPVVPIDGDSDEAAVFRWSLERFNAEMRKLDLGRSLILSHLAPIMLLQVLRLYIDSSPGEENWLRALGHPRLSRVLEAMQTDYKRSWSVGEFAAIAQMSRSGFALLFKKAVGVSPLVYLSNWRMQIACELLDDQDRTIASVAASVGYESESAFINAFHRIVGVRPGCYRTASSRRSQGHAP